jgi:ATP-binding cassette subfamily C (CFTR/MRP) protein 1
LRKTLLEFGEFPPRNLYLGVYGALGFGQAMATMLYSLIFAFITLQASKLMHNDMLEKVMRSPMVFFDQTPIGRIVNRDDIYQIF